MSVTAFQLCHHTPCCYKWTRATPFPVALLWDPSRTGLTTQADFIFGFLLGPAALVRCYRLIQSSRVRRNLKPHHLPFSQTATPSPGAEERKERIGRSFCFVGPQYGSWWETHHSTGPGMLQLPVVKTSYGKECLECLGGSVGHTSDSWFRAQVMISGS